MGSWSPQGLWAASCSAVRSVWVERPASTRWRKVSRITWSAHPRFRSQPPPPATRPTFHHGRTPAEATVRNVPWPSAQSAHVAGGGSGCACLRAWHSGWRERHWLSSANDWPPAETCAGGMARCQTSNDGVLPERGVGIPLHLLLFHSSWSCVTDLITSVRGNGGRARSTTPPTASRYSVHKLQDAHAVYSVPSCGVPIRRDCWAATHGALGGHVSSTARAGLSVVIHNFG